MPLSIAGLALNGKVASRLVFQPFLWEYQKLQFITNLMGASILSAQKLAWAMSGSDNYTHAETETEQPGQPITPVHAVPGREQAEHQEPVQAGMSHPLGATNLFTNIDGIDLQPALAFRSIEVRGMRMDLRLHRDRVDRVLHIPCERQPWMRAKKGAARRVRLSPFTQADALAMRATLGFDAAEVFSRDKANDHEFSMQQATPVTKPKQSVPIDPPQATVSVPKAKPQNESQFALADEGAQKGPTTEATGEVISAGDIEVKPVGRPPYATFSVQIRSAGGDFATFSGVDLSRLFASGTFGIGDKIRITRTQTEFAVVAGGKSKSHQKNKFTVEVLERAAS